MGTSAVSMRPCVSNIWPGRENDLFSAKSAITRNRAIEYRLSARKWRHSFKP
jgi:hypothetical protein